MLRLENIVKTYTVGDSTVEALQGVTMQFRKSEFVSILGPSGCGKTTLLNIIGGLDSYTSGDLVISGTSTKEYKDGDWDTYRNHSVGFVFQSYNLIPHQSVLANVELALTLSGVSRAERRKRAKEALEKVGLGDQLNKKPNQMSGGQMQRVAIARALVNDPEIILADEPTGALDSETSVQIMEILKEISKDKLIIMVTHNPDLAEEYSSRIIRLLDGKVISDTDPYQPEEQPAAKEKKSHKKPSMSFLTALSLSFNNLLTKKGRTFMTSFAGSIGIIGIALILSVSQGVQFYIDGVQEDTLSSYPITIQKESTDLSSVLANVMGSDPGELDHGTDKVYSSSGMYEMMNALNTADTETNDLETFKAYLESEDNTISPHLSAIKYGYDLTFNIYTKDEEGTIVKSDVMELMQNMMGGGMSSTITDSAMMQSYQQGFTVWEEMLEGEDGELINPLVKDQYDLVYGNWPESHDEMVLILNKNNELSDIVLYALGLESEENMTKIMEAYLNAEEIQTEQKSWSYEEIGSRTFRLILDADRYQYHADTGEVTDISDNETGLRFLYDNAIELKIAGIVRPNEDAASAMMTGSIGYTAALTRYAADQSNSKEIVKAQLADEKTDIFTNLPFATGEEVEPTAAEKAVEIKKYIESLDTNGKAEMYTAIMTTPSQEYLDTTIDGMLKGMDRAAIEAQVQAAAQQSSNMDAETIEEYIASMDDETLFEYVRAELEKQITAQYAETTGKQLASLPAAALSAAFEQALPGYTEAQLAEYYDRYMPPTVSEATLEENLKKLGYVDLNKPSTINLFASTFEDKDKISNAIDAYNEGKEEDQQIKYTDYVALLMSSVTTVINAISYVLIAFVAISLVVSSIMIGIITYISVLERTKEIGILRAIGASKKDISRVFNAETLIVGFTAGAFGIAVTLLLNMIINIILHAVTGIPTLNAVLPWAAALILVGISMLLTFVAGLIPSGVAARKDPVIALRTE
ncbi:MAG: ABC transporter ATP-binding protein/permease [Clostridia bacterium]|nr:ABC transporter ATP-binding protein/permease [Clostridia bacterium]